MPSTVAFLFEAADLASSGVVNWRTRVPAIEPGVYVVSIESEVDREGGLSQCPIAQSACDLLLTARPELTLDRGRPEASELAARISGFWFADEVVVYVGLAGTSLADRVSAYYRTKLGARRPHAGGWFLKTLEILPELSVHYAACQDPDQAEHDNAGRVRREGLEGEPEASE